MKIILVRHGETEWNRSEVFRGLIDVELNENGLRQAEFLGEYLKDTEIEAVYSSPLQRALTTAQAVAGQHGLHTHIDRRLIDLNMGKWQGLTRTEAAEKYKEAYDTWMNEPEKARIPGGESLVDVRERAMGLVGDLLPKHEGTIVLVSHRVICKLLTCALLGLDDSHFWNIEYGNCGMTTFLYRDDIFILTEHNNTSFLKPMRQQKLRDF